MASLIQLFIGFFVCTLIIAVNNLAIFKRHREILNFLLDILTKFSLPAVLISLGLSLSNFKISEYFTFSLILTSLKNFIHPVIAFILAKYFFSMSPTLVFIVTLAAALPSGSQTYYFSYRYDALKQIISSNIVLSTFVSFITIPVILFLFGY